MLTAADDLSPAELAEVTGKRRAAEREQMNGLRRSVAEVIGEDQDTWPDHGNAPLAIAATVALLHARCTRLEAELSTLREQLAESESERMESYRQGDKIRPVR